ncbi:glycosyltransferase family 2 protein [Candidatus Woesearchaeota archaeon]|nr:glycosyltransferase family 2 protein [Candidatus Woesearchaeota archaeon]
MKNPKVSVIILNYRKPDYTLKCISSVRKSSFRDYELIVVDNGSADKSVELFSKVKGIVLVKNKENLGFAGGNNAGVEHAKGRYICLLNNDCVVDKDWLSELVKAIETNKGVAVAFPKIFGIRNDGSYFFDEKYGTKCYSTINLLHYPFMVESQVADKVSVRHMAGNGFSIFDRKIIPIPFDPDYFAYAEDMYLGLLSNYKGYKVINVPSSKVYHQGSVTSKSMKRGDFFFVLAERNKLLNVFSFYSGWTLIRLIPVLLLFCIFTNIACTNRIISRFKAYLWMISNFGLVLRKRKAVQKQKVVSDTEIIKYLTCRLYDESTAPVFFKLFIQALNSFVFAYCAIVSLRTMEFHKKRIRDGILEVV